MRERLPVFQLIARTAPGRAPGCSPAATGMPDPRAAGRVSGERPVLPHRRRPWLRPSRYGQTFAVRAASAAAGADAVRRPHPRSGEEAVGAGAQECERGQAEQPALRAVRHLDGDASGAEPVEQQRGVLRRHAERPAERGGGNERCRGHHVDRLRCARGAVPNPPRARMKTSIRFSAPPPVSNRHPCHG